MDEAAINKRFWIVIAISATLLIAIGVGFFFVYQDYSALQAEIGEKTTKIEALRKTLSELKRKEMMMKENEEMAKKFEKYLPSEEDVPAMLKTMAEMATNNDLLLDYARVDNPSKTSGGRQEQVLYETWVFSLKMAGHYKNIVTFVNEVENLDRFVMVNSMKLNPTKLEIRGMERVKPTIEQMLAPQYLEFTILVYTFVYAGDKK